MDFNDPGGAHIRGKAWAPPPLRAAPPLVTNQPLARPVGTGGGLARGDRDTGACGGGADRRGLISEQRKHDYGAPA